MAKSTRSKVKRSYRHKKREEGVYAATEAARLNRMNAKLLAVAAAPKPQVEEERDDEDEMREDLFFIGTFDPLSGYVPPQSSTRWASIINLSLPYQPKKIGLRVLSRRIQVRPVRAANLCA
ncbi:hypothetical protein EYR36_006118 [Pleurotus pulmonarius]|nr:hypothetical protein EYR36_006118 [Pleurotus pulmonarius]KAF4600825.1 hypothetical protein EYR38_005470 [Pleurotus pulmonarius]